MAENDFLTQGGVPPCIGNAPAAGIDFRDMDYISENRAFLKMPVWEEAAAEFAKVQPEPGKIASFDAERAQFGAELQSLREEAEKLQKQIEELEARQKRELEMLEETAAFKNELLGLLPERYRDEGRRFLNNFIMRRGGDNHFPGEAPEDRGVKAAAAKLLFLPKLNKFKAEFARLSASFQSFAPRFDVSAAKGDVLEDVRRHYAIDEHKVLLDELLAKTARIEQKQQELLAAAGAERMSLDRKRERLKSYFDKHFYPRIDYAEVPFAPEKEKFFEKFESVSPVWRALLREARVRNIHFGETVGIVENDLPAAAAYDRRENRILCNPAFCTDEQVFAVAEILAAKAQPPLSGDYDAKTRYQYELCRQAEQAARMTELGSELAVFLPVLKSRVIAAYADEMSAFVGGQTVSDKYARAYVRAFSAQKVRQAAERETIEQIAAGQKPDAAEKETLRLKSLTPGEIVSPFVSRGAPLLNESAELKRQLGLIPIESKIKIQEQANFDKDYSLADMNGY